MKERYEDVTHRARYHQIHIKLRLLINTTIKVNLKLILAAGFTNKVTLWFKLIRG